MKNLLLVFFITFNLSNLFAQTELDFCGVFPPNQASTSDPDSIYFDRFGNTYDKYPNNSQSSNISQSSNSSITSAGYFDLNFHGDNWEIEMKDRIEDVFEYVSGLIERRVAMDDCGNFPQSQVLIDVEQFNEDSNALASASPYLDPHGFGTSCDNRIVNRAFKYLNSGTSDYYVDIHTCTEPESAGLLRINMFYENVFYYDEGFPNNDQIDFFTIILHEVGHILGFASLVETSSIMSIWDQNLYIVDNYNPDNIVGTPTPVYVNPDCVSNCWNINSDGLNGDVNMLVEIYNDPCNNGGVPDLVFGSSQLAPINNGISSGTLSNAMSHLNQECANENFVMHPVATYGANGVQREFSITEIEILCELGYKTSLPCEGYCISISNPEEHVNWHSIVDNCCIREYNVCQGEIFELTFSDLLCNDFFSPASGQEITNVYLLNNQDDVEDIIIDFINETISIEVSQSLSNNRIRLKYDAKSDCGCNIITSSFTLNLAYCDEECEDEPCDDLICVDGFDELEITSSSQNIFEINGFSFLYYFDPATDYCYYQNSFSLCTDGPVNTLQFGYKRGFVIPLQETATQGCDIEIIIEGSAVSNDVELLIFGSVFPPCSEYETTVPFDCTLATNCGSYLYSPICLEDILLIGDNVNSHCSDQISLDSYTISIDNLPSDINYLILSNNTIDESAIIHDIQLIENCSNSSFELEEVSCSEFIFNPFNQVEDVSFSWDFGDGESSNQMNPSHEFIENGIYTINLTVIDNCGNETTTSTEIFVECPIELICEENNIDLIFNGEDQNFNELSDFISNGTFTSNSLVVAETIIVNGQFTVNDNIRFSNCTFYFEPGAELVIQNTGLFSIVNSSLQGCTQMWKGIQVKEGGRFHFQGNTIMDAEFAINLRDGANFDSQLNTYDRNYIGIYSESSSAVKINNGTPIKSSNFYCTSPLLPPYGGQENWSSLTYAGISVSDLDHLIVMEGHSAPPLIGTIPNKFEGIENGILASNTNIRIESNEFINMVGDEGISISTNLSGACIVVENSLYASITKNDLLSSARGIILYNNHFGNLEVIKNEIGQINSSSLFKLGISLRHSSFSNISVNNNVIHSGGISNYGIDINNNYLLQKLEINNNKIFDKDFGLTSIKVDGVSFDAETAGFIESNYIEKKGINPHENYGMCFRLTNVEALSVESNQLNILGSPKRHYKSIYLANANNAHFRTNRINFQEDKGNGFVVLNSPQNVYCCNEVTKGNESFFYVGQNNGTTFVSNTLNDASKGLFLHDAQIGAQFHHGNLWLGNNITNATISSQTGNHQGIALSSVFTINPSQLNIFPIEVLPEAQSDIWFAPDFNQMTGNCEDNPDCGIAPYDPFSSNDNDNQGDSCEEYNNLVTMISSPILGGEYENQNRWTSEYSLWNTLNLMPNTDWQNCSILYDFYTNNQVIEEYSKLDQQIKNSINVSHLDFDSFSLSHSSLSNSIENLVSLHSTYFDEYGFDHIENQHSFYLDDIQLRMNILSGMKSVSLTKSQISATQLIGDVISLPEPSPFHKELKWTMKIRAKILATGISSISTSEWNTLNVIADHCFLEYGESVFQARNLLSNLGIDQFDDFDIACNYEIRANESKFNYSSTEIKIFPNPSAGEFIIRNLPLESSDSLIVEVYNTIGELVLKQIVKKDVSYTTLDLSVYKDGLYFINLRNNRNLIYSKKVILSK